MEEKIVKLQIGHNSITVYDPKEIERLINRISVLEDKVVELEQIISNYNEEDEGEQGSH